MSHYLLSGTCFFLFTDLKFALGLRDKVQVLALVCCMAKMYNSVSCVV